MIGRLDRSGAGHRRESSVSSEVGMSQMKGRAAPAGEQKKRKRQLIAGECGGNMGYVWSSRQGTKEWSGSPFLCKSLADWGRVEAFG